MPNPVGAHRKHKFVLDKELFHDLVKKGYNCKEIAKSMNFHSHNFGKRAKEVLGMYPSVYISKFRGRNVNR